MARKTEEFLFMLNMESIHKEKKLAKKDRLLPYKRIQNAEAILATAVISQYLFFNSSLSLIIKETTINTLNSKKLIPSDCL